MNAQGRITRLGRESGPKVDRSDSQGPRVIFILGWGRSGSTLLGNTLGELQSCVSVGELHDLWSSYGSRYQCGCGLPLPDCKFWEKVAGADPIVGRALASADEVHHTKRRILRVRYVPRMLLESLPSETFRSSIDSMSALSYRLYGALATASGASIIVDAGKTPAAAALLLRMPLQASYIHLVRDPRATGFSWQRRRFADPKGTRLQTRLGYGRNAASWLIWNSAAELIRRRVDPGDWIRIRYEDFVASPEVVLKQVVQKFGLPAAGWPLQDHVVRLGTHHTVEGNPSRFRAGSVPIQSDDEWRKRMSLAARVVSVAVTAPLFIAYGYHRLTVRRP